MKIKDPISTKQAADILGLSHSAVRKMVDRKQIKSEKLGHYNYVSRRKVNDMRRKREAASQRDA